MSGGVLCEFVAAQKTTHDVRRLWRELAVSKTAFYDWAARDGGVTAAGLEET